MNHSTPWNKCIPASLPSGGPLLNHLRSSGTSKNSLTRPLRYIGNASDSSMHLPIWQTTLSLYQCDTEVSVHAPPHWTTGLQHPLQQGHLKKTIEISQKIQKQSSKLSIFLPVNNETETNKRMASNIECFHGPNAWWHPHSESKIIHGWKNCRCE